MKTHFLRWLFLIALLSACTRPSRPNKPSPSSLQAGNHNQALVVDSLERTYILHVPPAVENGTALPLIVVLHGTWGTGRKMQLGLGFDSYADKRGFYVAYPDAYQKPGTWETARWNDGRGTLASSSAGIDDVKFIVEMVADIAMQVPLDKARVYVTGASNGGMMTYRLGCETKGIFAGIAPVIGNIPQPIFAACAPQAPIAFIAINGDADPYVPIAGGEVCKDVRFGCEGGMVASMTESAGLFAAANGCQAKPNPQALPTRVDDGTFIEQLTYLGCRNSAQVKVDVVHHGGHTWPPREPQLPSGGQSTGNLDATQTIVDFFIP
jgi:polyhydroxybutyrate depolymerase